MGFFSEMGRTLVVLREMKGFRQSALARAAGIGKSQLSKYEGGKELPKLETLERILASLEIEPVRFFESVAWINELARAIETGRRYPLACCRPERPRGAADPGSCHRSQPPGLHSSPRTP